MNQRRPSPLKVSGALATTMLAGLSGAGAPGAAAEAPPSAKAKGSVYSVQSEARKPGTYKGLNGKNLCNDSARDTAGNLNRYTDTFNKGPWITNRPCKYYIGTALPATGFDVRDKSDNQFMYGWSQSAQTCGWVSPGTLGSRLGASTASGAACDAQRNDMLERLNIGKNFNSAPNSGVQTGSPADVNLGNAECRTLHANLGFAAGGGARNQLVNPYPGKTVSSTVLYRYTTKDDKYVVVRDPGIGWGFMKKTCFDLATAQSKYGWQFNNDPDRNEP